MMRQAILSTLAACGVVSAVLISPVEAFDLDGFYTGLSRTEVMKKLSAQHLELQQSFIASQLDTDTYTMYFCNNNISLDGISKKLDFREFNTYLLEFKRNYGDPEVHIYSLDKDIIYLQWKTKAGTYLLNSGTDNDKRFHVISIIDNSFCS